METSARYPWWLFTFENACFLNNCLKKYEKGAFHESFANPAKSAGEKTTYENISHKKPIPLKKETKIVVWFSLKLKHHNHFHKPTFKRVTMETRHHPMTGAFLFYPIQQSLHLTHTYTHTHTTRTHTHPMRTRTHTHTHTHTTHARAHTHTHTHTRMCTHTTHTHVHTHVCTHTHTHTHMCTHTHAHARTHTHTHARTRTHTHTHTHTPDVGGGQISLIKMTHDGTVCDIPKGSNCIPEFLQFFVYRKQLITTGVLLCPCTPAGLP